MYYYCKKAGLIKRGILHDMSKFHPIEFFEGVKYYNGGKSSPINECIKANGYSKAWLHHKGRNKHHYDYWIDMNLVFNGENEHIGCEMPLKYVVEMLCDYLAAGRTYMEDDFTYTKEYEWWKDRRWRIFPFMHIKSFAFIEHMLSQLTAFDEDVVFKNIRRLLSV